MEKGVLDVKLLDRPPRTDCNTEHSTNCYGFKNGAKRIKIAHPILLMKAFRKSSFVTLSCTIESPFYLDNPFTPICVVCGRRRNQGPSAFFEMGIEFIVHGLCPFKKLSKLSETCGFDRVEKLLYFRLGLKILNLKRLWIRLERLETGLKEAVDGGGGRALANYVDSGGNVCLAAGPRERLIWR